MDPQYRIERLDKSRFGDIAALYKAVYGKGPDENFFSRKYNTAYTGKQNVGFLAYQGSIPVAFYGVIPCFIEYEKKIIACAQSADTMTDQQHRYKGLFAELARLTYALCQEAGIGFVFGFPNQYSYHGLAKTLEWVQTETLDSFTIPINTGVVASAAKNFALTKPFYKAYAKSVIRKNQTDDYGIPNSVVENGYGGVYRDAAYLKYKRFSDTIVMKIGSAKVWVRIKNNLWIGDIANVDSSENLTGIIEPLKSIGKRLGLPSINFQASPGTSLHNLFMTNYKPSPSFATMFLDLGAHLPFARIKFTLADIDIF